MTFWDQAFSVAGYKYGTAPNAFLRQQAHLLPSAARILVPGDGEGRNGVWLATQGHAVTSVDQSSVGLDKARQLASTHGVSIETVCADLLTWSAEPAHFDALVLIYLHLPDSIRRTVHQRLLQAVKPGGWLIVEAFHPEQLQHSSGGPKDRQMLYTPAQLQADWGHEVDIHVAWDGETWLDEGPGHQGLAHVTRWVAQKIPHPR